MVDRLLPEAAILIGQTAMPKARLDRAPNLKAIFNVETNFLPNIDYEYCQARGVWVLSPTSSFAQAVAESALAMAIDLARGITAADRAFRAGGEPYGLDANEGCFMFAGAPVGIIGFGDLGRTLRALLTPFRNPVTVYDPWLPADVVRAQDCKPATLDEVLSTSRVIFVFASVTTENQGFLGKRELDLIQPGSAFLLMSRAAVVDFPELLRQVESGRFKAAIDVFPQEPVPADHPVRKLEGAILSAHRTGGMPEALVPDRAHDGRGCGADPARPAAGHVPARRPGDRQAPALHAGFDHMRGAMAGFVKTILCVCEVERRR